MSFKPAYVLHEGPIVQLEVAHNEIADPSQVVRLTLWQKEHVYLTEMQCHLVAAALLGSVGDADGDG